MKVGKAFPDPHRGGWVVHVSGAESPALRGVLTEPILTKRGYCFFRLAHKSERDLQLLAIAESARRKEQFAAERAESRGAA